ncbi:hypothetical protein L226DRAFT_575377 [Lentinus tigrinus ALCF2SS1-7]|uniref:uncharacterized protein n=1 Tax=Lentinus tigrinus ALCF2SS1-7 TaxID=1328758 RepID=UPI001165DA96|nr:hypothetical protein L226DRAFT_575377 [Lentinus tigrinus ALCF2SS1-7]
MFGVVLGSLVQATTVTLQVARAADESRRLPDGAAAAAAGTNGVARFELQNRCQALKLQEARFDHCTECHAGL